MIDFRVSLKDMVGKIKKELQEVFKRKDIDIVKNLFHKDVGIQVFWIHDFDSMIDKDYLYLDKDKKVN